MIPGASIKDWLESIRSEVAAEMADAAVKRAGELGVGVPETAQEALATYIDERLQLLL